MRRWAVHALEVHKEDGLQQLKDDPDEMLRGAHLNAVPLVWCHDGVTKSWTRIIEPLNPGVMTFEMLCQGPELQHHLPLVMSRARAHMRCASPVSTPDHMPMEGNLCYSTLF